jgi:hypothetical protein
MNREKHGVSDEERKRLEQESHAFDILFRSLPPEVRRSIQREMTYKQDLLLQFGYFISAIERKTGNVIRIPTKKAYDLLGSQTAEDFESHAEELKRVGLHEYAKFVKQYGPKSQITTISEIKAEYMDSSIILEPHTIFDLRDRGEIAREEEKDLLEKYESYDQEQERLRKLTKNS